MLPELASKTGRLVICMLPCRSLVTDVAKSDDKVRYVSNTPYLVFNLSLSVSREGGIKLRIIPNACQFPA